MHVCGIDFEEFGFFRISAFRTRPLYTAPLPTVISTTVRRGRAAGTQLLSYFFFNILTKKFYVKLDYFIGQNVHCNDSIKASNSQCE